MLITGGVKVEEILTWGGVGRGREFTVNNRETVFGLVTVHALDLITVEDILRVIPLCAWQARYW